MEVVGIDTEFSRNKTYRPILCLIQVSFQNKTIKVIDPILEKQEEYLWFLDLLQNDNIIKIIHACEQDIEVIYNTFNVMPKNVIDLQIFAKHLGLGKQISYSNLVKQYFNVEISKQLQYSNWQKRPLSNNHIEYAKEDVRYLIDLYNIFIKNINDDLLLKVKEETNLLTSEDRYNFKATRFWNNKKYSRFIEDSRVLLILKNFIIWREKLAYKINRPREHIIKLSLIIDQLKEKKENIFFPKYAFKYKKDLERIFLDKVIHFDNH